MRLNCLTNYQKDQLLHFFEYNMSMELRQKLMRELPEAYNRLVGMDVVEVVKRGSREEPL